MTTTSFRTDSDVEEALTVLTRPGVTRSDAIRGAILEAAKRAQRARMRREAEELMRDAGDVSAARALAAEMATRRAR